MLILKIFCTCYHCFYCWLWTCICLIRKDLFQSVKLTKSVINFKNLTVILQISPTFLTKIFLQCRKLIYLKSQKFLRTHFFKTMSNDFDFSFVSPLRWGLKRFVWTFKITVACQKFWQNETDFIDVFTFSKK